MISPGEKPMWLTIDHVTSLAISTQHNVRQPRESPRPNPGKTSQVFVLIWTDIEKRHKLDFFLRL